LANLENPLTPEEIRIVHPKRRTASAFQSFVAALLAWCVAFAMFRERNGILLFGVAALCGVAAITMCRRSFVAGGLMLAVATPYLIARDWTLAAALKQDLKAHHWTAYALDGTLGPIFITAKILFVVVIIFLIQDHWRTDAEDAA
jgi:hypothetical protein